MKIKNAGRVIFALFLVLAVFSAPMQASAHPVGMMGFHMFHHMHHMMGAASGGAAVSPAIIYLSIPLEVVAAAAIWHIPAWNDAKTADGNPIGSGGPSERAYQRQEMWPQQLFDKLPGGTPGRLNL